MIVWLKTRDGQAIRLVDFWQQCFYIGGKYGDLINLVDQLHVEGMSFEEKLIKPEDNEPSTILKVPVRSVREAERLAERVLIYGRCGRYELYNVDINPSQLYMYEKGVYPFGYVKLTSDYHGIHWKLNDSLESTDYEIPPLREITLSVEIQKKDCLPRLSQLKPLQ